MEDFLLVSEHALCRRFSVSRVTVRLALADLEYQGLIYRRHGRGTFARGRRSRGHADLVIFGSASVWRLRPLADLIAGMQAILSPLHASLLLVGDPPSEWSAEAAKTWGGVVAISDDLPEREQTALQAFPFPCLHLAESGLSRDETDFFALGQSAAAMLNHAAATMTPIDRQQWDECARQVQLRPKPAIEQAARLSQLSGDRIEAILRLVRKREDINSRLAIIETQLAEFDSKAKVRPKVERKPKVPAQPRQREKILLPIKEQVLAVLRSTGPDGLRPKEIAQQIGRTAGSVAVWLYTNGMGIDGVSKPRPGRFVYRAPEDSAPLAPPGSGDTPILPDDAVEVDVTTIKNTGTAPVSPRVRLESQGGPSATVAPGVPIAPGAESEIIVPFPAAAPWVGMSDDDQLKLTVKKIWGGQAGTGTSFTSNRTNGLTVLPDAGSAKASLELTSIFADMPPPAQLPDWLGKRPPTDGNWVQTFDDEFNGNAIDLHKWNVYTPENWHLGKLTHFSKDNVLLQDGKLLLRLEKRTGYHNDNPATGDKTDYATGYADTYGKWTQRYGYFEARLKLPHVHSAWTAFWLMPDRGADTPAGGYGKMAVRTSTKNGGMEFDIMEALAAWGPWRHDIGMHWDDYQHDHKSIGDFSCYYVPDAEGFDTVGMLWTPGEIIMYDNGKESVRWDSPRVGSVESYILLNYITGGWESDPIDDRELPSDFVVDYVRVWQRKDLASPKDGPKKNEDGLYPPKG